MSIMKYFSYIAYFYSPYEKDQSIVLCASDDPRKCRYYCERIRRLSKKQYEIREVLLDENSLYSLFEDYVLEEFDDQYLFLTLQDIYYLTKEVDQMISRYEALSKELKAYRSQVREIPELAMSIHDLDRASARIDEHLSSVANIRLLCSQMYKSSPVFSPNIYEYFQHIKVISYDREMNDLYTYAMEKDG